MFEQLIQRPHHLARHYGGPYSEERQLYLSHLISEGRARNTLNQVACLLLSIARHLSIDRSAVTIAQIEAAAEAWLCSPHHRYCSSRSRREARTAFISHATKWLRLLGHLHQSRTQRPFASELDASLQFQRDERGLVSSTISCREKYVGHFLAWVRPYAKTLKQVTPEEVSRYFVAERRWGRSTIALHVDALRAFFRFAESRQWCTPGLPDTIDSPRVYRNEHLPRGPEWGDVQRLLAASNRDTPTDIRDRAILLLYAVYGLRNSEVCLLRLGDLDWENETILVARHKQRKSQLYPLIEEVGSAILRYLREARPHAQQRELFLSMKQPYRPVTAGSMYAMVRGRQLQIGLALPHYGPHSLRHACATHLLVEGFSLKEIGDHLGHMSTDSTQIYAKVDLAALREVARMDLRRLVAHVEASGQIAASISPRPGSIAFRAVAAPSMGGLR